MLETYLQDLAEVVNLDCGSANCEGVTKVANIMKRHFDSIGFATELVDLGPKAGKGLFATNKPGAEKFDIMFNAHLDTVFPDGTAAARPFKVEDGKVTGPGCADCKAGVIAIFHALKNARKEDLDRLAIAVCYNPDEEISSLSSREWLQQMASKCKRAIVCEPGRATGAFVRSRKGRSVWNVVVHGVAAKCTLKIDTRCWNDEDGREIDEGIEALAKQNWGDGITVEATRVSKSPAMPCTDATKELVEMVNRAAKEEGYEATWVDAGGGSDANRIAQVGVPVIDGVAPAGAGFHSEREYLRVDTIDNRVRTLSRVLQYL